MFVAFINLLIGLQDSLQETIVLVYFVGAKIKKFFFPKLTAASLDELSERVDDDDDDDEGVDDNDVNLFAEFDDGIRPIVDELMVAQLLTLSKLANDFELGKAAATATAGTSKSGLTVVVVVSFTSGALDLVYVCLSLFDAGGCCCWGVVGGRDEVVFVIKSSRVIVI